MMATRSTDSRADLPFTAASRVFRLFVSSTFEDFHAERGCLQEHVFPALQSLCQSLAAVFQPIDLRWGVSEEAGHDHRTLDICLTEIDRCLTQTVKPNCLVMLGDRYGWRPLPPSIDEHLFRHLLSNATAGDRAMLLAWYRVDANQRPPRAFLQPRAGRWREPSVWTTQEAEIRFALQRLVALGGLAAHPEARRLFWSATHHEIHRAVFDGPGEGAGVFVYARHRTPAGASDAADRAALASLRASLEQHAGSDRRFSLSESVDGTAASAASYLERFRTEVQARLEGAIREQLALVHSDPLSAEQIAHAASRVHRVRQFLGRTAEVAALLNARPPHSGAADGGRIALLEGETGTGKSSLLAKLATTLLTSGEAIVVVERYVGATPDTADPLSLLRSVAAELRRGLNLQEPQTLHGTLRDAMAEAQRLMAQTARERPLVVILDGLDQLQGRASVDWITEPVR